MPWRCETPASETHGSHWSSGPLQVWHPRFWALRYQLHTLMEAFRDGYPKPVFSTASIVALRETFAAGSKPGSQLRVSLCAFPMTHMAQHRSKGNLASLNTHKVPPCPFWVLALASLWSIIWQDVIIRISIRDTDILIMAAWTESESVGTF